jgi:ADP-ribose pyrophosphatase YjhB (NUDIX family)
MTTTIQRIPIVSGVTGVVKGLKDNVVGTLMHPAETFSKAVDLVPKMLGGVAEGVTHDFLGFAKNLIWDGFVKPAVINPLEVFASESGLMSHLTPDETYEKVHQTTALVGGFALGSAVARGVGAIAEGGEAALAARIPTVNGVRAAEAALALHRVKTIEDAIELVAQTTEGADGALALSKDAMSGYSKARNLTKWGAGHFVGGASFGYLEGKNPEEAFAGAINMGIVSVLMAPVTERVFGRPEEKRLDLTAEAARQVAIQRMIPDLMQIAPHHLASELLKGAKPEGLIETAIKIMPEGMKYRIEEYPTEMITDNIRNMPGVVIHDGKNGMSKLVITGTGIADAIEPTAVYPIPSSSPVVDNSTPLPAAAVATPGVLQDVPPYMQPQLASELREITQYTSTGTQGGGEVPLPSGNTKGSNDGGLYIGKWGDKFYVKFHQDKMQVYAEAISNTLYRMMGMNAPKSRLTEKLGNEGQLAVANELIPDAKQLAEVALTPEISKQILQGYAMDVLLSNRDVLGTGVTALDNVVVTPDGQIHRIDQGGTFMFRGMMGKKGAHELYDISEWDGFYSKLNPYYKKVFDTAGIKGPSDMAPELIKQITDIETLVNNAGGWKNIIDKLAPALGPERGEFIQMLAIRYNKLIGKREELKESLPASLEDLKKQLELANEDVAMHQFAVDVQDYEAAVSKKNEITAKIEALEKKLAGKVSPQPDVLTFDVDNAPPSHINGIPVKSWSDAPEPPYKYEIDASEQADWTKWIGVKGVNHKLKEPPLKVVTGKKRGAGTIIVEPDGSVWLVEPTNHFSGTEHTFPKGRTEGSLSMQETAIKEAYEESGLKVDIIDHLVDQERGSSIVRYYLAKRTGGTPVDAGWESQSVKLVPFDKLEGLLNKSQDKDLLKLVNDKVQKYYSNKTARPEILNGKKILYGDKPTDPQLKQDVADKLEAWLYANAAHFDVKYALDAIDKVSNTISSLYNTVLNYVPAAEAKKLFHDLGYDGLLAESSVNQGKLVYKPFVTPDDYYFFDANTLELDPGNPSNGALGNTSKPAKSNPLVTQAGTPKPKANTPQASTTSHPPNALLKEDPPSPALLAAVVKQGKAEGLGKFTLKALSNDHGQMKTAEALLDNLDALGWSPDKINGVLKDAGYTHVYDTFNQSYFNLDTYDLESLSAVESAGVKSSGLDKLSAQTGQLNQASFDLFKKYGFFLNENVMYGGKVYEVMGERLGKLELKAFHDESAKPKLIPSGKIVSIPGRIELGSYKQLKPYADATEAMMKDLHKQANDWLAKLVAGDPDAAVTGNMPIMPIVRAHDVKHPLDWNPNRGGRWYSFAADYGYSTQYGASIHNQIPPDLVEQLAEQTFNSNGYGHGEGGNKSHAAVVQLKNPLILLGKNVGIGGNTGRAILKKLRPELEQDDPAAVAYLQSRGIPDKVIQYHKNGGYGGFEWLDLVGAEVARELGYTEVLNLPNSHNIGSSGNEFVLLYQDKPVVKIGNKIETPYTAQAWQTISSSDEFLKALKESDPHAASILASNAERLDAVHESVAKDAAASVANFGLYFKAIGNGKVGLYNTAGRLIQTASSLDEAMTLAAKLPDISNIELIPLPTAGGGGGGKGTDGSMVPFEGTPEPSPAGMRQPSRIAQWRDKLNTRLSGLATPYSYFTSMSNLTGKDWFNNLFYPLQKAKLEYLAALKPMADRINKILAPMEKYTAEQRNHLYNYIQTFSAAEIESNAPTVIHRALNDTEKQFANDLGFSNKEWRVQAYQAIRAEIQFADLVARNKMTQVEADAKIAEMYSNMHGGVTDVVNIMKDIRSKNKNQSDLHAIMRLVDARELKTLSRPEYAKQYGLTPVDVQMASEIDKLYEELGPKFGINPKTMLGGYLTHVSQYDGSIVDGSLFLRDGMLNSKEKDFIYSLPRTGENQNLLTDPAEILMRYTTAGMKSLYLYPKIAAAMKWAGESIEGMNNQAGRGLARRVQDYVDEIRGFRNPHDALVNEFEVAKNTDAAISFMQRLGVSNSVTKDWLRTYLKVSEVATQGFKPIAGIRDATSFLMHYYVRYGSTRTMRMMKLWSEATKSKENLLAAAKMPGLNVEFINTLDAHLNPDSFLDKVADSGFKYSGQPFVFEQAHAMAYLESHSTTLKALTEWVSGGISRSKMEKLIDLDSFDAPQVDKFNQLVEGGKYGEAANYLADLNGREVVGYYGIANHPFFMQNRVGKVLGQHGQWPMWMLQNFGRMMSQGSGKRRIATAAKIAMLSLALKQAGNATDTRLDNWMLDPTNTLFMGGPLAQAGVFGLWFAGSQPDTPMKDFAYQQLTRYFDYSNPQFYVPIPSQAYNIVEAWRRAGMGDPMHVVGARLLGIRVNTDDYPRP